ncbi:hypothetical protein FAGKG844_600008 [Frankia sp. AgKG'84/4]
MVAAALAGALLASDEVDAGAEASELPELEQPARARPAPVPTTAAAESTPRREAGRSLSVVMRSLLVHRPASEVSLAT